MIQRGRSRLVTAIAVGITALLVVAAAPDSSVSASERSSRVAKGAAWDAQALPALPGSSGSGQTSSSGERICCSYVRKTVSVPDFAVEKVKR